MQDYNGILKIHYTDNGIGIEDDQINAIFTPFYKGKNNHTGMGLGLSIAKKIVTQQLQGNISVIDSNEGVHFY